MRVQQKRVVARLSRGERVNLSLRVSRRPAGSCRSRSRERVVLVPECAAALRDPEEGRCGGSVLRLIVSFAAGPANANDEGARGRRRRQWQSHIYIYIYRNCRPMFAAQWGKSGNETRHQLVVQLPLPSCPIPLSATMFKLARSQWRDQSSTSLSVYLFHCFLSRKASE